MKLLASCVNFKPQHGLAPLVLHLILFNGLINILEIPSLKRPGNYNWFSAISQPNFKKDYL